MPPQRDDEMAAKYGVPIDALRSRLHHLLRSSPDDEIVQGEFMRVATANGLRAAITMPVHAPLAAGAPAPPPPPPLKCYLVSYLPPGDAAKIRELKTRRDPSLRQFKICNAAVMEDKYSFHMQILASRQDLEGTQEVLLKLQERLNSADQDESRDMGLKVGAKLNPLKTRCVLALLKEGKIEHARQLLKNINLPLYRLIFQQLPGSPRGSEEEERDLLVNGTDIYQAEYVNEPKEASTLGNNILGLVSMCDFQDQRRMAEQDPALLESVQDTLVQLQKKIAVFQKMSDEQSLIGATNPDFREI